MLALFDLTRDSLGEDGALRAVFYLIVFPTGFFLIQVYTEGLFVGLAFGCLAMLKRQTLVPCRFARGYCDDDAGSGCSTGHPDADHMDSSGRVDRS